MKLTSKLLIFSTALTALLITACGGKNAPIEKNLSGAPDVALETIIQELADGNGGILWQAMPASYQTDVNAIAQLAGSKVDAEIYDKSFSFVGRLAEVADKQKEFILNTELGGEQPAEQIAKVEAAWPSIIGFVETIATSSVASTEGLKSFDGQTFADGTISSLIEYLEDLAEMSGEENPLEFGSVKLLESTETTATLEMTSPDGEVETEDFIKVENRWVPVEMATDWKTQMADAKAKLEAISPEDMAQNKPQIMGVITMLEGVLTQIETAETQEQFDQALQGAMMPIMGLMMMQQGMGAPAAPSTP